MAQFEPQSANVLQLTVSELAQALKRAVEDRFGYVRIRGEISGFRGPHASGHVYFALKDESARIDAVIWRSTFLRMQMKPEEGLEVIATGKITTFSGKSSYQIIVESIEPAGIGALMALLETRRLQFASEGLFDLSRKRSLPYLPRVVGIVTSPSGSVIRDIIHRLSDRCPVHLVLWPARVQGDGSAEEIAAGIRGLSAEFENIAAPRAEVVIVARGGGALEDLWSFNDELVVRAAAGSTIPLISAVGHETDWTLLDYVADVRAPTPTAAAEICVPVRAELLSEVQRLEFRRVGSITRALKASHDKLRSAARGTRSVASVHSYFQQRVDLLHGAIRAAVHSMTNSKATESAEYSLALSRWSPASRLARAIGRIRAVGSRFDLVMRRQMVARQHLFDRMEITLQNAVRRHFERRSQHLISMSIRWSLRRRETARLPKILVADLAQQRRLLARVIFDEVDRQKQRALKLARVFATTNYKSVLSRGFALVFDNSGAAITRVDDARLADSLLITFADGSIKVSADSAGSRRRSRRSTSMTDQKSLF